MSIILTATMYNSGSHSIRKAVPGEFKKVSRNQEVIKPRGLMQVSSHLDTKTFPFVKKMNALYPTVTTLRHPARMLVSRCKRADMSKKPRIEVAESFWRQWQRLDGFNAFRFPIEELPWDELEEFLGMECLRHNCEVGSIGDYPEKYDFQLAKDFLGDLWKYVEYALDTPDGKRYSDTEFPKPIAPYPPEEAARYKHAQSRMTVWN